MNPILFHGRSIPDLGRRLAKELGLKPGRCRITDFADGEVRVEIKDLVEGRDVILLQSTTAPAERNLIELLLMADACRRRGARRVTAVLPYFAYARQDRRISGEEPIGARLMTDLLAVRCDRIVTVDLHNPAIEGFANVPLEHLSAVSLLADAFQRYRRDNQVLVAPDAGSVKLAQRYGKLLKLPVIYLEKIRESDREVSIQAVAGRLKDRSPVLVDDMISTGGTMVAAIEALSEAGTNPDFSIIASHCLLSDDAAEKFTRLPIGRMLTTDSIPRDPMTELPLEVVTLAPLLADALQRFSG